MPTPPHLAELALTPVTTERFEDYLAAMFRGFHHEYVPELWGPGRAVVEPDRSFGVSAGDQWVATCTAYSRTLTVPGGQVPAAAVTFVTVSPAYRRRGLLRQMMTHQLRDIAERGEPVAYLWASEAAIYGRFGYGEAAPRARLSGRTQLTSFRPEVDLGGGSVGEVEPAEFWAVVPALHAGWLADRPGALVRSERWWDVVGQDPPAWRHGAPARRFALHYAPDGSPDGYLSFRASAPENAEGEVQVHELDAGNPAAYAALWRFVLDLDLIRAYVRASAPVADPLRLLLADSRGVRTEVSDGTYVRVVDVPRALQARRYPVEVDVVLRVRDPLLPANDGVFRLQGGPEGATVQRTRDEPALSLDVRELGAIYLGGVSLADLARAGLVTEHRTGAVTEVSAAFDWPRSPFCPDPF